MNSWRPCIGYLPSTKEAVLDVVQQYHSDLAQRFADEAALIPRRAAIVERLHGREQQIAEEDAEDE